MVIGDFSAPKLGGECWSRQDWRAAPDEDEHYEIVIGGYIGQSVCSEPVVTRLTQACIGQTQVCR
ncbi:hypothetical protein [Methylocystis sp.]|uniref:hypothetical protein n=1 Tax=Methylocystis sp. TaxID=1911079 RepID=UPI003DA4B725